VEISIQSSSDTPEGNLTSVRIPKINKNEYIQSIDRRIKPVDWRK
jgi:hypothetical protein